MDNLYIIRVVFSELNENLKVLFQGAKNMGLFDDELEIIKFFQTVQTTSTWLIPTADAECKNIFDVIHDQDQWVNWINSSGKGDLPPDFFSDKYGLMMEVMRVDDHGHLGKNKRSIVNPTLQREAEVTRELKEKGIFDMFPNAKFFPIVDTKLPTKEDHNYIFYRDSFIRTIEIHKSKIKSYQRNHPNHKMVFFVFDESSPYFQIESEKHPRKIGSQALGRPHFGLFDKVFMEHVLDSRIDYLIWFTPWKHCEMYTITGERFSLPEAAIINVNKIEQYFIEYDIDKMESAEL